MILEATGLTVEYESVRGQDAVALVKFPNPGEDDRVLIVGSLDDLRGVVDTISRLLDDLEE